MHRTNPRFRAGLSEWLQAESRLLSLLLFLSYPLYSSSPSTPEETQSPLLASGLVGSRGGDP